MRIHQNQSLVTFSSLSIIQLIASLELTACGTGNSMACDGKTTARCGSGGTENAAGGSNGGGYTSTSTTVLKIEGSSILDLSKPNPGGIPSGNVDAGNDLDGTPIILRGVNRSGTEYRCVNGYGIFDGPDTEDSVKAIAAWKINAVRIPLNESCWLGINNALPGNSGSNYKTAIQRYVTLLHKYDIYPILELHWVAPGTNLAMGQLPMPDADHAIDFWKDVTVTFKDDLGVIFELFNEPYPDRNRDTDAAWQCWRDGCTAAMSGGTYAAAGFQQLVNAVREAEGVNTTASHVILLGGVMYSNRLTQWSKYKPADTANNLGAAWHIYNFNGCANRSCFDGVPATLGATTAVVATEFGQNDCLGDKISDWMNWFDSHKMGHLAWTWDVYGNGCIPESADPSAPDSNPWPLISSYESGTPNPGLGQTVHDHFLAVAAQ